MKSSEPIRHKTKKDHQEELQTKYIQLQLMKQQLKALVEERNIIMERVNEMVISIDALQTLDSVKKEDEMWSSIGSSTFVRSDIKDTENVLVSIGAGIVVKETRARAIEILDGRMNELKKIDSEFIAEITKFAQAIEILEPEVEKLAEEHSRG